jgi:4-amino-4-deoxy-L-arabinose transferase-like glycosyltransferase
VRVTEDTTVVTEPPRTTAIPAGRPAEDRAWRRLVVVMTLLVGAWAATWAVVTPPMFSADEQNHLNSALRVAYGGGWPDPGEAYFAPVIEAAVDEAAYPADLPGRWRDRDSQPQFVDLEPRPASQRTRIHVSNALPAPDADPDALTVDQMTQHPPAYYVLGALVLRATGLDTARWDVALTALRLLDVVLFMPVVPLAAAATRRVTGSRSAGLVAATFPLFVPQLGHAMGAANNDALVVLTAAVATYLAVRVVTGDLRWRLAVGLGVVVGLGMLTKVMAVFLVPTVVAAYLLVRGVPWRGRLSRLAVALVVAACVGGWWWVRNLLVLGKVQPVGLPRDVSRIPPTAREDLVHEPLGRLAQAFWGHTGWLDIKLDGGIVAAASTLLVALALVSVVVPGGRRASVVVLLVPGALAAGVIYNAIDYWTETQRLIAITGRYVFGGITGLAVAVGVAAWQLARHAERRLAFTTAASCVLGSAAAAAGLVWGVTTMYQGPGEPLADALHRWAGWSALSGGQIVTVVAAFAVIAVVACALCMRWAVRLGSSASQVTRLAS